MGGVEFINFVIRFFVRDFDLIAGNCIWPNATFDFCFSGSCDLPFMVYAVYANLSHNKNKPGQALMRFVDHAQNVININ